jgi:hypothetical protein
MSKEEDITRRKHGGNIYSTVANERTDKERDLRLIYFKLVAIYPEGLTADECDAQLGIPLQTASARFADMKRYGWIEWCGTRMTRAGSSAGVWRVTKEEDDATES